MSYTSDLLREQICPPPKTVTTFAAVATIAAAGIGITYQDAMQAIKAHPLLVGEALQADAAITKSSALSLYDWLVKITEKKDGRNEQNQ